MSGNKIVINQTSGLDQININQGAPNIVQVQQPVTNIVEVRSIGPQGIQGPPGIDAESPFRKTGSYWSTGDDIYITGSLKVTNTIVVQGAISASIFSGSFVGDGAGLTNITASTVDFANVINKPTLISSSLQFNDLNTPFTGSYTGSFTGDGVNLYNIPASAITGLNLSRIASGSVTASIAPNTGLQINTDTTITGGKLAVVGTGSAGVVSNFGIAPLTSSFTVWDSQYYASSSQLGFLGPYSTNTVLATLVNKKPFGSVTDDDYTQFANYLELSYTASDADRITLNRGIIDINLSSSYTQSGDITANWTNVTQRGNGYNSVGFTNTYIVNTVSQSSYSDNTNGLWTVTSVNSSSVLNAYGVRSGTSMARSASIDTLYLFQGLNQASTWSRINNAYGLYLTSNITTNASMSNYAGVTVTGRATGSVSNALVLLGTGSIPVGNWSIYNTSSFQNYLRGWVGINKETPTTNLDIIGDVFVTGSIRVTAGASGSFSGSFAGDGSQLTNIPASGIVGLNLNQISSGSVSASISPDSGLQVNTNVTATSFTGSLQGSASYAATASIASIQYVTSSIESLSQIEVADFDSNVAVTFVNGRLKFIFGTPTAPSAPALSFNSTFATDRFNQVTDNYTATGTVAVGAYTLISASIYEGGTLLSNIGSGTTITYNTTTSGSHTYRLEVTASSPLDGTINQQSTSLSGTLSKSNPGTPTISATPTVQLGATSNQIEQGATGSIAFTSASGATNNWVFNYMTSTPATPIYVTGSATGSTSITILATAYYSSSGVGGSDNNPPLNTSVNSATTTYTKIRSLRYGVSTSSSFSAAELENLSLWDTTLGGNIGTIAKGTTTATGQSVSLTWTGDKYHYIVYNSALADLTNITAAGFSVFSSFTKTTVGSYKVYKTTLLQSGYAGTSITYVLT